MADTRGQILLLRILKYIFKNIQSNFLASFRSDNNVNSRKCSSAKVVSVLKLRNRINRIRYYASISLDMRIRRSMVKESVE